MFAALSATNEAIMRAKSRDELFDMVCEATVNGGRSPRPPWRWPISAATSSGSSPPQVRPPRRRGTSGCRPTKAVPRAVGSAARRFEPGGPASPTIMSPTSALRRSRASSVPTARSQAPLFQCLVRGEPVGVMIDMSLEQEYVHIGVSGTAATSGRQRGVRAGKF